MTKLIFGCGYLGERVARLWRDTGHEVATVTRSAERAARLAGLGLRPIVADIASNGVIPPLPPFDTVLFAVGHDRQSPQSIHDVYLEGLRHALTALLDSVRRFIYISSTGVYAQTDGEWVDEDSATEPTRDGGRACLAAEQLLAEHPLGRRAIVLRLAGLYGPGRIPLRRQIEAGEPLATPSDGFLNLIHVDDAAQIVLLAETHAPPPQCFVISDGHPVPRSEYYEELARLLHAPPPTFQPPDKNSPAARRSESDKRIKNARMLATLQPQLQFPSYREGLAAIVSGDLRPTREP